jgi:phosphoserine phosphatase
MPFFGGMTLRGANCLGAEKIRRLRKILPGNIVWSVAYSDHRADLPLLLASKKRVVVNPTQKNRTAFLKHLGEQGFTEVSWSPLTAQNLKK